MKPETQGEIIRVNVAVGALEDIVTVVNSGGVGQSNTPDSFFKLQRIKVIANMALKRMERGI